MAALGLPSTGTPTTWFWTEKILAHSVIPPIQVGEGIKSNYGHVLLSVNSGTTPTKNLHIYVSWQTILGSRPKWDDALRYQEAVGNTRANTKTLS